MPDEPSKPKRARPRWFQWSLRSLFILTTVWAVLLAIWQVYLEPLRREWVAIGRLREGGFSVETEPAGPAWLRRVVGEENLQHAISVHGSDNTVVDLDCFAELSNLPRLRSLSLWRLPLTDQDLAAAHGLNWLESLDIYGPQFTDAVLMHLEGLARLKSLHLSGPLFTGAGLMHVKGLVGLESLHLRGPTFTDAGLMHLKGLAGLKSLYLTGSQFTDAGLVHLAGLAGLETLSLSGPIATDAGLVHLRALPALRYLSLGGNGITDAGIPTLVELSNLEAVHLHGTQVTLGGEERLIDARLDLGPYSGFAEHLYDVAWQKHQECPEKWRNVGEIHRTLFCFQVASDWKLACAPLKRDRSAEAAALEQLTQWLRKFAADQAQSDANGQPDATSEKVALVQCALADARIRLARAKGDRSAEREACEKGLAETKRLSRASWASFDRDHDNWDDYRHRSAITRNVMLALEWAARLEVADARRSADRVDEQRVLEKYIADLGKLNADLERLETLHPDSKDPIGHAMIRVWLAEAQARRAQVTGDKAEVNRIILQARADTERLREVATAIFEVGVECGEWRALRFEKAAAAEVALARAVGDAEAETSVKEKHRWLIGRFLLEEMVRRDMSVSGGGVQAIIPMLQCLYATKRLQMDGKKFYDEPAFWVGTKCPESEKIRDAMKRIRQSQKSSEDDQPAVPLAPVPFDTIPIE